MEELKAMRIKRNQLDEEEFEKKQIKMEHLKTMKFKRQQLEEELDRLEIFTRGIPKKFQGKPYKHELKMRLQRSKQILTDYEVVQGEVEKLQHRTEFEERRIFEERLYRVLEKLENETVSNASIPTTNNLGLQQFNINAMKSLSIDLPNFDGKYECWRNFRATFDVVVNENPSLTHIQRFLCLKSSLREEAANFLNSLEVSESNYQIAWAALVGRYENKTLIINAHIKGIFDLPTVVKGSCEELQSLIDNFTKHLILLKNYNLPTDTWDALLIYIINSKLDDKTKHDWEKLTVNKQELSTISELIKFLTERCHLLDTKRNINAEKPII